MNYLTQWLDNGPWMEGFFFILIFIFHIFIIIEKRKKIRALHFGETNKTKENHLKKNHSKIAKSFGLCIFEHYIKL
jgi:hypothetical protein